MKKLIFFIILVVACFVAKSQTPRPAGFPAKFNTLWERIGYSQSDSGTIIATRDTSWIPRFAGTVILWRRAGIDTAYWYFTGQKFDRIVSQRSLLDTSSAIRNNLYWQLNSTLLTTKDRYYVKIQNPSTSNTGFSDWPYSTTFNKSILGVYGKEPSLDILIDSSSAFQIGTIAFRSNKLATGGILDKFPKLPASRFSPNAYAVIEANAFQNGGAWTSTIEFYLGDSTGNNVNVPLAVSGPGNHFFGFRNYFTSEAKEALYFGTAINRVSNFTFGNLNTFFAGDLNNLPAYFLNAPIIPPDTTNNKVWVRNPTTGAMQAMNWPATGGGGTVNLDTARTATDATIIASGTDAVLLLVNRNANKAGLMSPTDKGRLDSLYAGLLPSDTIRLRRIVDSVFLCITPQGGSETCTFQYLDSLGAILIVDTVVYTHSGAEADSTTNTELIGKTIISTEVHPYNLHLATSYPPATEEVYVNTVTGGTKFGTALQAGQTVTWIYKYLTTTGTPVVEGVQVNGGPVQTGIVSLTIPTFSFVAGKSIRKSGDTVINRVDVADSSYAVLAGVIRGTFDTATSTNTWAWISNSDHGNINIKDSVVANSTGVQIFYDSSTYQKVVTFLIVPDETASRIAQSTGSFQGKAGSLFWSNGGYTAGASVALTTSTITFSNIRGLSVQVVWNGSAWVMTNVGQNAINFNSTSPTISYSAGRLRIQDLPFNMKQWPAVMGYAPNGVDSLIGYQPAIEVINQNWVDIYFWDSKNNVKYTAATPPTNFGVYINFGLTFAACNPQTEDMGFNSNWWVIAIMKKTLTMPVFGGNIVFILILVQLLIIAFFMRKKKVLWLLFLLPVFGQAQIVNRGKSFGNIGTTGIYQYNGTTAQRPTTDLRWFRWNSDSARLEVKINSGTWRSLAFNGEGGGGGITTLNTLTASTQTFATGTSGTDFNISSATSTHTFNFPDASATNRGLLTSANWTTFNNSIDPADTSAMLDRAWRTTGNTAGALTYRLGTVDNNNWDLIANNTTIGRVLSATGKFHLGGTTVPATNIKMQISGGGIYIFSNAVSNLVTGDDAVNTSNATNVLGLHSNSVKATMMLAPSGAATLTIRDYGQTTDLFTIGQDVNISLTHLLTDASTIGSKWAYAARNTFNPTSGTATRYAFEDSTVINQTGGANGIYASFYAHPVLTAAADYRAFWNTVGNNTLNTTSGNTSIATSSPTARLHIGAGTASANTAPLKLTSGTDLTTAEAGAFEFGSSRLAFTPSGTTRKRVALSNDATPSNGQLMIGNGTDFTTASVTSSDGSITITPGAGTLNIATTVASASGVYTPTVTIVANLSSASAPAQWSYIRIGSQVYVWGSVDVDPTSTATVTEVRFSLPVTASFADENECAGTAVFTNSVSNEAGAILADITNEQALLRWTTTTTAAQRMFFSFGYRVGGS